MTLREPYPEATHRAGTECASYHPLEDHENWLRSRESPGPWELQAFVRDVTALFPAHKTLTALIEMTFDRDNPDESRTLYVNNTQRHDRDAIGTFGVMVVARRNSATAVTFYLKSIALGTGTPWELSGPILLLCRQHEVPVE